MTKEDERVLESMVEKLRLPPVQGVIAKLLKDKPKLAVVSKKRANGLTSLVKRYEAIQKESGELWAKIASSCTHAEQDLHKEASSRDNTYGRSCGTYYYISCNVCHKILAKDYKSNGGY
jgi:hypothetical protein